MTVLEGVLEDKFSKLHAEIRTRERRSTNNNSKLLSSECTENPEHCCDKSRHCKFLADRGHCSRDDRMPLYCPDTCQYCRPFPAPKCSQTMFGCCWDKRTVKVDKRGSNCPLCKDDYRYVCRSFLYACGKLSIAGKFMLMHCTKTCAFCSQGCKDDLRMSLHCEFWKRDLNWCNTKRNMMNHFCPATCGFC